MYDLLLEALHANDFERLDGHDLNRLDEDGFTLLLAYMNDFDRLYTLKGVQAIVTHEGDPSLPEATGWTPLHFACRDGRLDVVKFLLSLNVNLEARESYGNTPLKRALSGAGNAETVFAITEALLQAGSDPLAENHSGVSSIGFARRACLDPQLLELLQSFGH